MFKEGPTFDEKYYILQQTSDVHYNILSESAEYNMFMISNSKNNLCLIIDRARDRKICLEIFFAPVNI
jgi:hypothetical protein